MDNRETRQLGSDRRLVDVLLQDSRFAIGHGLIASVGVCVCLIASISRADAIDDLRDRYNYTPYREGLPQNTVKAIAQTSDGYLWFGTRFGLVRFDGVNFKVFDPSSEPALQHDNCSSLVEDRADRTLWIGQPSRITGFKDRQFTSFEITTAQQASAVLRQFCAASDGGLWMAADHGLLRFQNGQITRSYGVEDGLKTNMVRAVFLDEADILWVGTVAGVQRLNTRTGEIGEVVPDDRRLVSSTSCVHKSQGELWVANDLGLHVLRNGGWQTLSKTSQEEVVEFIERDSSGKVWIGGARAPLRCIERGELLNLDSPWPFVHRSQCMREDREGNLWFGTPADGVARLQPQHVETYSKRNGLLNDDTWSICEGRDGTMWIGSDGGITRLRAGQLSPYPLSGLEGPARIKAVYEDRRARLWVGTKDMGLQQLAGQNWRSVELPGKLADNEVGAIAEDRSGQLWVGAQKTLYRLEGEKFVPFRPGGGESVPDVRAIHEDQAGQVWFGTYRDGLYRLRDGAVKVFNQRDGLPSNCVWALYEDSTGAVWIGTDNGLARFKDGVFSSFTKKQGLFDNVVNSILEDAQNNLWISCNRGIYEVPRKELEEVAAKQRPRVSFIAYGTSDGMLDRETNGGTQPSALKSGDGSLWFPTVKGVVRIDPEKMKRNQLLPPLVIQEVIVDGKRIDHTRPMSLAAGSGDVVQIHYTGNSFVAPEKVLFRYCLDGCDRDWSEPTPSRVAYYTNLKPRKYTFRVKACNNHGVWNEAAETFSFQIAPHFYERWSFILISGVSVVGMGIGIGFGIHRVRVRVLRKIQGLEQQHALEKERARIAQEMHDDLGASLTQIGLLGELAHRELAQPTSAEAHLQKLKQTTRELFRSMDEIVWAVNPKHDTVPSLVDYICRYAQQYLRLAEIRFRLDRPEELPDYPLSSDERHNLFLAVKEALNNVVKHAAATEVWLRVRTEDHQTEIILEDNGRGFDLKSIDSARNGLANMQQRLSTIGGRFAVLSEPAKGAKIRFTLPSRARKLDINELVS